jgi:hypothetical protein
VKLPAEVDIKARIRKEITAKVNAASGVLEKLTNTRSRATKISKAAAIIRWPNMRLHTVD